MNEKRGPWTLTSSKKIYNNPWISVREDQVLRPDGKPGIYGVVTILDGVTVLALDDEGYVYLTRGYQYASQKVTTETINGGIDKHEAPADAAKRELKEEAGIEAKSVVSLGALEPYTSIVAGKDYLFLAQDLTFGQSSLEGTESFEIIKIPFEEAYIMALDGGIAHASSCACILKAKAHLEPVQNLTAQK